MLSAALDTSSLHSSGVVTPITTPTTNLFLFRQSQRHGLSSSWANRHALHGPRDKLSTSSGVVTPKLLRLPTFLCSGKVKGTAYRVVGLRDTLSAALKTSSLPSSGVVTPITTTTTNLSLFRQSQRHGPSNSWAKRHALRGPREKLSTFSRVVTPITTPTTNLSMIRQSQSHGLSSSWAKRHANAAL